MNSCQRNKLQLQTVPSLDLLRMNNSSLANVSEPWVPDNLNTTSPYVSPLSGPGFVVFNIVLLVVVVLPVVVLNGMILLALLLETSTARVVRLALGSILVSCLIVALGLAMYHISGIILNLAPVDNPSRIPCTITVFLLGFGGAARLIFMATFAVTVYTVVKYRRATTLQILAVVLAVSVILWIVSFLGTSPLLSEDIVESRYVDSLSCGPRPINLSSYIFVGLYVIFFGIGSFSVTTLFLVMTVCFIKNNTISDKDVKKAMLKFGFFLLMGNGINLLGSTVPPFIAAFIVPPERASVKEEEDIAFAEMIYIAYIMFNISLVPTPILVPIYFKPIRKKLVHWLCCILKRKKTPLRRSSTATSSSRATEVVSTGVQLI